MRDEKRDDHDGNDLQISVAEHHGEQQAGNRVIQGHENRPNEQDAGVVSGERQLPHDDGEAVEDNKSNVAQDKAEDETNRPELQRTHSHALEDRESVLTIFADDEDEKDLYERLHTHNLEAGLNVQLYASRFFKW